MRAAKAIGSLATLAALIAVVAPGSATASFDHHFSVLAQGTGGHETPSGFAFRAALFNPANPANRVGNARARCRVDQGHKPRCRLLFHLDGSIGGFGDLLVKGNFGHGDQTFTVADGDGDFGGRIAGKVTTQTVARNTDLVHFDLIR
jgi:hypothetical protein